MKKKIQFFLVLFVLFTLSPKNIFADGDYFNIGTPSSQDGSYDAVSWSASYPITIDQYGKYIVPVQTNSTQKEHFAVSNNGGSTWFEIENDIDLFRTSLAYDSINDRLHAISANSGGIFYRRFVITRDSENNITNISLDSDFTSLALDGNSSGGCSAFDGRNPIALFKNTGDNGILVAFWSVKKTCDSQTFTDTRASMRVLTDSSSDGDASSWVALDDNSDEVGDGGPAYVDYDVLYAYEGDTFTFQHSAMIKGGQSAQSEDIYYFNVDQNDTHGFRRLAWNSGNSNWSGSWTARQTFGGVVSGNGYGLKEELISKPVYESSNDRVYVGIARWLNATDGDTQSLFYVDSSDTIYLAGNVYSAGGTHSLYPTFDLAVDQSNNFVYFFYLTSGGSDSGHTYYKTYDGANFSSAMAFFTADGETVDIPVTYQQRYDDKIQLFFRKNQTDDEANPPHEIFYGYLDLDGSAQPASGTVSYTSYNDFNQPCITSTSMDITGTGEIEIPNNLVDDFTDSEEVSFSDRWSSGTWGGGSYNPDYVDGKLLVRNVSGGAYILSDDAFNKKVLRFNAKFTNHNWQHIGFSDGTGFGRYAMFSTGGTAQLSVRLQTGSGDQTVLIDSGNLGSFHDYRIEWGESDVKFYVDDSLVHTFNSTVSSDMNVIASNNTTVTDSLLTLESISIDGLQASSGTYTSCYINGGRQGMVWTPTVTTAALPSGASYTLETRNSSDNKTWSSWTSAMSGSTLDTMNRFIQYRLNLNAAAESPSIESVSIAYSLPSVGFSSSTGSGAESTSSVSVPVTLSHALSSDLTVNYALSGTATGGGTDYSVSGSSLTISAGETSGSIPITIVDDAVDESDETIILTMTTSNNLVQLSNTDTFTYTITDNDVASTPTPAPAPTSSSVNSANTSETQPEGCKAENPGAKVPTIYAASPIDQDSIELFITPADGSVDHYYLQFGTATNNYQYGASFVGNTGTRTVKVHSLHPGNTYYFRVRAGNGCATGDWSDEFVVSSIADNYKPTLLISDFTIRESDDQKEQNTENRTEETKVNNTGEKPQSYSVTINVKDTKNQPVAGATVTMHSEPRTGTTNESGEVTFEDVEPGDHDVFIAYDGYEGKQEITLDGSSEHIELDIKVTPVSPLGRYGWWLIGGIAGLSAVVFFLIWKLINRE